jgi:hypothetical protein
MTFNPGSALHPSASRRRRTLDLLRATPRIVPDGVRNIACLGVSDGTKLGHLIQLARRLNPSPVVLGDRGVLGVAEANREQQFEVMPTWRT